MKILKKVISAIVALAFVIICCPVSLYAKGGGHSGYSGAKSSGSYKNSSGGYKSSSSSYKTSLPKTYTPKSNKSNSSTGTKVNGYSRKDGTYVRPHYRSSPDNDKSNNFGQPSGGQRQEYKTNSTLPTYKHDYNKDGLTNARGKDDDSDLFPDNIDRAPYNPNKY